MNKNIIFFDIDGTLVDEKTHLVPESTINSIEKVRNNGHLIFINTGRPLAELNNLHKSLPFDGLILGCGTYIEYNNEVLFHKSLGKELTRKVINDLSKYNLDAVLEGRHYVYFDKNENIKNKEVLDAIDLHVHEGIYQGKTWHEGNIDSDKLVVFLNENSDLTGFYEKYKDTFEFIQRTDTFYELVPLGFSKASGIEYIINHLNVPHENTFAIGDSTNDLSMLEYVSTSIAMGNSNPILFDKVSFVTKDVDKNGIYHALNHYKMI